MFEGESRVTEVPRREMALEPAVVKNVSSNMVTKRSGEPKLCVNGSSDRYEIGDRVTSRRPQVLSSELRVGYNVDITTSNSQCLTGRIERVYRTNDDNICYDVKPDGVESIQGPYGIESRPRALMRQVPPSQLTDQFVLLGTYAVVLFGIIMASHKIHKKVFLNRRHKVPIKKK